MLSTRVPRTNKQTNAPFAQMPPAQSHQAQSRRKMTTETRPPKRLNCQRQRQCPCQCQLQLHSQCRWQCWDWGWVWWVAGWVFEARTFPCSCGVGRRPTLDRDQSRTRRNCPWVYCKKKTIPGIYIYNITNCALSHNILLHHDYHDIQYMQLWRVKKYQYQCNACKTTNNMCTNEQNTQPRYCSSECQMPKSCCESPTTTTKKCDSVPACQSNHHSANQMPN